MYSVYVSVRHIVMFVLYDRKSCLYKTVYLEVWTGKHVFNIIITI